MLLLHMFACYGLLIRAYSLISRHEWHLVWKHGIVIKECVHGNTLWDTALIRIHQRKRQIQISGIFSVLESVVVGDGIM
jgi:hypothetical protein